ncbi:uncharacterized protein [Nicotiana tomentosiformis]|uniref:uncharacterized protein n=1 Tax=Nicotiana tomentosiformis TaxID=4098 RepID=UPI00388C4550
MGVWEYSLQFDSLAKYAPTIVAKMEDRVHRIVMGLEPHLLNNCMFVSLRLGIDISRIQAYAQGVEESKQKQRADHEHDRGQSHVMRDYPTRGGAGIVQPAGSVVALSSSVRPPRQGSQAPVGRGRDRSGASSSSDPQNRAYALEGRRDQESSPDIVTDILSISSYDVYALIDTGSNLSYGTLLVASKFWIEPELIKHFDVSTLIGDTVIARRVYRYCIVVVHSHYTVEDLIELDIVEIYVIMGMDWLASCYANVDYRSKMVRFQFPGEQVLEWKGNTASPKGRYISNLKARKMIKKGYIYHLVWVQDVKAESPTLQSILVVNEFPDIFPDKLPGLAPEQEIEFAIDILPDTQPISIPLYTIAPTEIRELKEQLRELLEKALSDPRLSMQIICVLCLKFYKKGSCMQNSLNVNSGKANVVADALRRISMGSLSYLQPGKSAIASVIHQLGNLGIRLLDSGDTGVTIRDTATSSLVTEVKECQYEDPMLAHYRDTAPQKEKTPFEITRDGVLRYRGEAKIYHDIREIYWWDEMKKDIEEFVAQCPNCLPHTQRKSDSIWVIVDRLTKSAHFLPVRTMYSAEYYARLYIKEIVRLHGVPVSVVSNRGSQFTTNF